MNIVLISPPGGGKGTQAPKISNFYKIPHISTGDIFRGIIKGTYTTNLKVEDILNYINSGKLVPDDIVVNLVIERVNKDDCKNGFILDGFPRTLNQAIMYENIAQKKQIEKVIYLEVNENILIKRLTGRRNCPKCGKIYNIYFNPPKSDGVCDDDGEKLQIRSDDNETVVKERLDVYNKETKPLIEYYTNKKILYKINAEQEIEIIFNNIKSVLGG